MFGRPGYSSGRVLSAWTGTKNRGSRWRAAAPILTLAVLLGCTTATNQTSRYSPVNSERMLKVGFSDIQEIYIGEPAVSDLAVAGLQGLRRIEPDIAITRNKDVVQIRLGDDIAGAARPPHSTDAYAWAHTVSKLLDDGRNSSLKLKTADTESIYAAVFDGMTRKLDGYSRYAGASEAYDNRASRDGFGGIGVTIVPHDVGVQITNVAAGLPADKAGLRRGDRILSIDGHAIAGMKLQSIARRLQGPVGRQVSLMVRRLDKTPPIHVAIRRTHITPQTVFTRMEDGFTVIELSSFNAETAASVAQAVLRARIQQPNKLRGLIIDLRENPGGLLHQAVRIADLFIERGRIISTTGRHRDSLQVFDATPGDIAEGLPIAVLINGASASAAEILAAALQDHGRAVLIGATSYGKGTVQTVLRLPNDGELVLTWARLHAPSGYSLNGLGVVPTICTVNARDAQSLVQRTLANDGKRWRHMLDVRRNVKKTSETARKTLESYCPQKSGSPNPLDLKVAKMILAVQKRYMQTLQLARSAHGL